MLKIINNIRIGQGPAVKMMIIWFFCCVPGNAQEDRMMLVSGEPKSTEAAGEPPSGTREVYILDVNILQSRKALWGAVDHEPDSAMAHTLLGINLARDCGRTVKNKKNCDLAISEFKKAMRLDPKLELAYYESARTENVRDYTWGQSLSPTQATSCDRAMQLPAVKWDYEMSDVCARVYSSLRAYETKGDALLRKLMSRDPSKCLTEDKKLRRYMTESMKRSKRKGAGVR